MKNIQVLFNTLIIGFTLLSAAVYGNDTNNSLKNETATTEKNEPTNLEYFIDESTRTGEIPVSELITRYEVFAENYQNYQPSEEEINQFKRLDGFELVVFFGLWCHDSQREVPKLLKLIKQSNTYFKSVKLVALNTNKVLSEKFSSNFEVTKTPTFFILDNRKIIAKMVEKPQGSLSKDLVDQIFNFEQASTKKQSPKS